MPIIADVHFHFERALEAIEAGVHKIRLNPGNIKDRPKVEKVIEACKERKIPIRVGVNEGAIIERGNKQQRAEEKAALEQRLPRPDDRDHGREARGVPPHLRRQRLPRRRALRQEHRPAIVLAAYKEISKRFDYPLHLGVTHAGPKETGPIRSVVALGALLAQGIGDTIRISYANDPIYEVERRQGTPASPRPAPAHRARADRLPHLRPDRGRPDHADGRGRASRLKEIPVPIKVAVMGCVVNGPGEAEGADVAIFAGEAKGIIYVQGEQVATVREDEMLDALFDEVRKFADKVQRGEAKLKNRRSTSSRRTRSETWAAAGRKSAKNAAWCCRVVRVSEHTVDVLRSECRALSLRSKSQLKLTSRC